MDEMNPNTPGLIPYEDIPRRVRDVLDEIYLPKGSVIWWNSPNKLLVHYVPKSEADHEVALFPSEHPQAAYDLANGLADGVFF